MRQGINQGCKWISGSSGHGCWLGSYESAKQDLLRKIVRPGMKALDIGANAGFYTLGFSRLVGPDGHVWAFEPLAENIANLYRHVESNDLRNVTVVQVAVSDKTGFASFDVSGSKSMGKLTDRATAYQVPTVNLDKLVADGVIPSPDIVKMDVEGAESAVLGGAVRILESRHATWLVALHGEGQRRNCVAKLEAAGYRLLTLNGQAWRDAPPEEDELLAVPV